ncbi:MAG: hypothetical protein GY841_05300 [FCB group bacterium]|nr:hypothetical protein [FCB group bacterium]
MKILYTAVMLICLLASAGIAAETEKAKVVKTAQTVEKQKAAADLKEVAPPPTRTFSNSLKIGWQAVSGGGLMRGESANFDLNATSGQPAAGDCSSDNYGTSSGFWQDIIVGDCCDLPGDANGDEAVNIGDPVYLINYIFKDGPAPFCDQEGDANYDCAINIGDPVYLINHIFKDGPAAHCGCVE